MLLLLLACKPQECGSAVYVLPYDNASPAAELFDSDGDGDADLVEMCGVDLGSYGYSRSDLGLTTITLSPEAPSDAMGDNSDVTNYILPGGAFVFLTEHLQAGNSLGMEALGGSGLHHLMGTMEDVYASYDLLEGTVEVMEGPKEETDLVYEGSAQWKIHWSLTLGDPQSLQPLQIWDATDWIRIGPGTEVGDPIDYPPDYSPS